MGNAQSSAHLLPSSLPAADELADNVAYAGLLFWETLAELEVEEIESVQLGARIDGPGRTAKMMVADLAYCDERGLRLIQTALTGTPLSPVPRSQMDRDARVQEVAKRPWLEVEEAAKAVHRRLIDFARTLTSLQLAVELVEGTTTLTVAQKLQERMDALFAQRRTVQAYCGCLDRWGRAGLRKLMVEQHDNLMNSMAGLTEETMLAVQVCGDWTIRDVFAHVLSWNEYCWLLLRHWPQPDPETIRQWQWLEGDSRATFNRRQLAARANLTMIEIADGLTTEYRRMLRVFDRASDADLRSEGLTWGGLGVMSNYFYEIFIHEAEHAAQIWAYRAAVAEEAVLKRSDDA
jgi:hypothetical protein